MEHARGPRRHPISRTAVVDKDVEVHEPGTYMIKLTVGNQTLMSSAQVLDDTWMRPQ